MKFKELLQFMNKSSVGHFSWEYLDEVWTLYSMQPDHNWISRKSRIMSVHEDEEIIYEEGFLCFKTIERNTHNTNNKKLVRAYKLKDI